MVKCMIQKTCNKENVNNYKFSLVSVYSEDMICGSTKQLPYPGENLKDP